MKEEDLIEKAEFIMKEYLKAISRCLHLTKLNHWYVCQSYELSVDRLKLSVASSGLFLKSLSEYIEEGMAPGEALERASKDEDEFSDLGVLERPVFFRDLSFHEHNDVKRKLKEAKEEKMCLYREYCSLTALQYPNN